MVDLFLKEKVYEYYIHLDLKRSLFIITPPYPPFFLPKSSILTERSPHEPHISFVPIWKVNPHAFRHSHRHAVTHFSLVVVIADFSSLARALHSPNRLKKMCCVVVQIRFFFSMYEKCCLLRACVLRVSGCKESHTTGSVGALVCTTGDVLHLVMHLELNECICRNWILIE